MGRLTLIHSTIRSDFINNKKTSLKLNKYAEIMRITSKKNKMKREKQFFTL